MRNSPAQSSPTHILNALPNDCIGEILRRLPRFEDFLNAATTCKRFRDSAACFRSRFESIAIEKCLSESETMLAIPTISADRAPMVLQHFGHLIKTLEWKPHGNRERNDEIFKLILLYCGKTLQILYLSNYNPKFNKRNRFEALQHLILLDARPKNFRLDSPLQSLRIKLGSLTKQPWFIRPFPHLKMVHFDQIGELTDDMVSTFLQLNPQLRRIKTRDCDLLSPQILNSLSTLTENIEVINIESLTFREDSTSLSTVLRCLRGFRKLYDFWLWEPLSLALLMDMFAKNRVPIVSLSVSLIPTVKVPNFPTFDTLRHLHIRCPDGTSNDYLIKLICDQHRLETLSINHDDRTVPMQTIEKILDCAKYLREFRFHLYQFDVKLDNYYTILGLAKGRCKVEIWVSPDQSIHVPTHIMEANKNWLTFLVDFLG